MKYLTTLLAVLFLACSHGTTDDGLCTWGAPEQVAGTGTGAISYQVTQHLADLDLYELVPINCEFEITGISPMTCEATFSGTSLGQQSISENGVARAEYILMSGGDPAMILFTFTLESPQADYDLGDTWEFKLE